jgi:hypothetical protein
MNINSESQNVNPVLVEALALAKSGMYVYPTPKKNGPAHIKWRKGSSTDPATITAWWRKWPNALIGLDCERSGIAAIDADTIKGHGVDGIATLTMLELEHGDLPPTWMQESPSGSKHYLFTGKIKTTAGEVNEKGEVYALGAGVDTRGHGGMIVLAPSHVKGKGSYKRLNDLAPGGITISATATWRGRPRESARSINS